MGTLEFLLWSIFCFALGCLFMAVFTTWERKHFDPQETEFHTLNRRRRRGP
jgi:hypothetical protein